MPPAERAAVDPASQAVVARYFQRMTDAFVNALENARRGGVLKATVDSLTQARFFTSTVLGMAVLVRSKAPPELAESAEQVLRANIAALAARPRETA